MKITLYLIAKKKITGRILHRGGGSLVACKDGNGLFKALNMSHCSDEWRLFIYSLKVSLKSVLLHNGNVLPSIPVTHAFGIKESYDSMKQILQYIKYVTYKWNICADLKVIALLLGLQLGYTKFPCFLCEWDSRDKVHHYVKWIWPLSEFSSGLPLENSGSVSDEHGERFHKDIAAMEGRYKGKWSPSIFTDDCWTLMRNSPNVTFNRQVKKAQFH